MHILAAPKNTKYKPLLWLFSSVLLFSFFYIPAHAENPSNLTVTAKVNFTCTIKVHPEKRVPIVNHWMNRNIVEIRPVGSTTPLVTQVVEMDADGVGQLNSIDVSSLPPGNYDIAIKGYSHLREVFENYTFVKNTLYFDLTTDGIKLLAGDTSVVEDNYINSLDMSNAVRNIYSGDLKNDLNRDGVVNSLDTSNIVTNIYKSGTN